METIKETIDTTAAGKAVQEDEFQIVAEGRDGDAAGDDIDADSKIDLKLEHYGVLNSHLVKAICLAIGDVDSREGSQELINLLDYAFGHILRLLSSVQSSRGPSVRLSHDFVNELRTRVTHIAEAVVVRAGGDEASPEEFQLHIRQESTRIMMELTANLSDSLAEFVQHKGVRGLTYHGAHAFLNMAKRLFQNTKEIPVPSNPKLNALLVRITEALYCPKKIFIFTAGCQSLFAFFKSLINFNLKHLKVYLMKMGPIHSKYFFMGLTAKEEEDKELHDFLVEKSEEEVFNDKNISALTMGFAFESFYAQLDEESLKRDIIPQAQLIMNRTGTIIPNVTTLAKSFSVEISSETALQLTSEILNREYLSKHASDVSDLLTNVISKVKPTDLKVFAQKLVIEFLLEQYQKAKLDATVSAKERLLCLKQATHAYLFFQKRSSGAFEPADSDKLTKAIFEQIIATKEDQDIPTETYTFLTQERVQATFFNDLITNQIAKVSTATQINFLTSLALTEEAKGKVLAQALTVAGSQNLASSVNSPLMLSLLGVCSKFDGVKELLDNEALFEYLTSASSFVNREGFFHRLPGRAEVINHLNLIESLFTSNSLKPAQQTVLVNTLLNYLFNEEFKFRSKLYTSLDRISAVWKQDHLQYFLTKLFAKATEVSERPVKLLKEEETSQLPSTSVAFKVKNVVGILLTNATKANFVFATEEFVQILRVISHPVVSSDVRDLKRQTDQLSSIFGEEKYREMFDKSSEFIIHIFLRKRTGVLSSDKTVQRVAVNVLISMAWAGFLETFITHFVPILNYKPVELLDKMENLLKSEFERINHYDLMFFSEVTRDLAHTFKAKDVENRKVALAIQEKVVVVEEEEKKEEVAAPKAAAAAKPVDLKSLMKKAASAKKKAPAKGAKGKKGAATSKAAAKPAAAAKEEPKKEAEAETKEERNKLDREQMLHYIQLMRQTKATHVSLCLEILRAANLSPKAERLGYQDLTLSSVIKPLLKLLYLKATRFPVHFFLHNLFNENSDSPFFHIKKPLLHCMNAIASNKLTQNKTTDFSTVLSFLEENANYAEMQGGYLQVTLTIANYVLKDPSVNLSVKEIGLTVTQSILDGNSAVKMLDLVRLTINMLKTNYISNNLGGFLRKLIRRTSREELAMVLQPLFEYQPVPRKQLLTEILNYDDYLFCPVWFSSQMWMLLFDEDLGPLARKIWNKFGLVLRQQSVSIKTEHSDKNLFHYLRDDNFNVFNIAVQATASAAELFRMGKLTDIVTDLIEFYATEWKIIEKLSIEATDDDISKDPRVQMELIADERTNRIAVPQILERIADLLQPSQLQKVLEFLVTEAVLDKNDEVHDAASSAAYAIIKAQGEHHAKEMLTILETFLNATTGNAAREYSKNQAVQLIGALAKYLGDTSQKKLISAFEKLVELLIRVSEKVRQSICKCIPQLAQFFPGKAKVYLAEQLKVLRETKDDRLLKSAAYATAGLLKCLGMTELENLKILDIFASESFDSKRVEIVRKVAGLNLYEALSFSMGRSFEVYLPRVFPHILGCISDSKEPVRWAAQDALKMILANFSNFAIKQALPQFLKELEQDSWRSKFATVEALGNMAYCAPKQISSFLPQIVKGLREVMNDTHEKVHEAAIEAISKIGSVIKCPEVGDMLEAIIKALSNSAQHLNHALNLLLQTSFVHSIDAPSLSLLVPLLDSGLMMHDNKSKSMAAQLMGNICSLTQDPADLLPYMSILMPAIKNTLFDSIPEIRASSAKALGRLSKGLGIVNSNDVLVWVREHLNSKTLAASERSGSAQGFAELISVQGDAFFQTNVEEVIINSKHAEEHVRESYRTVLVFLPNSYPKFSEFLPRMVPIMIEGLADEKDEIRKVSMRTVKICIKQYGRDAPNQLVTPVLRMMFSNDFRVRSSSSILMYQLVKELENDIIKAQPKYVSVETKHQILSSMFVQRFDIIDRVSTQASTIWKNLIDNQLMILKQVLETLTRLVFQIIQSPSYELQEMGLACMRGMVEKFGEKVVNKVLDIFETLLDKSTDSSQTVGICRVLFNMASAASYRLLVNISPKIMSILDENLHSESAEIREWTSKVFTVLFQRQTEKSFIDPVLDKFIFYKLKMFVREQKTDEIERLIISLKIMLEKAKELRIEDRLLHLCDISNRESPFSIAQGLILKALAPTIAPRIFRKKFYHNVLLSLEDELNAETIDDEVRIQYSLEAYAELLTNLPQIDLVPAMDELYNFHANCVNKGRYGFYLDVVTHYCNNTENNYEKMADTLLNNTMRHIANPDPVLIKKVINAMNAVLSKLPKETQFSLVPLIRERIEKTCATFINPDGDDNEPSKILYKKNFDHLELFKQAEGVKSLVTVVQAAIMHGSVQVRIDSAVCFKYLLDFSPPETIKKEIIKICGALIRVVNDKFPQDLKLQIFLALKLIQINGAQSAKAMQAQLQTTFLKALGDPQSSLQTRRVVLECLLLLIKGLVRVDPVVKELNALLEGSKIDGEQKVNVSEALALVIRAKGKAIQSAMSATVSKTLSDIISESSKGGVNDKVLSNCSLALAYLSAYASDPKQMEALFSAYDDEGNDCIILPMKLGILTNGSPDTAAKKQMTSDFEAQLVETLEEGAGFTEVDDDIAPLVGGDDESADEMFHFMGALDTVAHLANSFCRREWCQLPNSPYLRMLFGGVNKSATLKNLLKENEISEDSFKLLVTFLAQIPIKTAVQGGDFLTPELAETVRDGFECIQKFYLEHDNLHDLASVALQNMLMINYDNFIEADSSKIEALDKARVKTALSSKFLEGVIPEDMKLYTPDIMFKMK